MMIERAFTNARQQLGLQAAKAIESNETGTLGTITQLLPVLSEAEQTVYATLGDFGDIQPLSSGQATGKESKEEQFANVVTHLHTGFADAQDVLFSRIREAIQTGNMQEVEHTLEHTIRVANAWRQVEELFSTPEIQNSLDMLNPNTPTVRRERPQATAWDKLGELLLSTSQPPNKSEITGSKSPKTGKSLWTELNQELKSLQDKHSYDIFRQMRLNKNMTQSEVAKKAGNKSISYVSAIERGQIKPSIGAALELFAATGNDPRKSILPVVWLMKAYEETMQSR